jgi:hypothetical protein
VEVLLQSDTGFPGLGALALCRFTANVKPTAQAFTITGESASTPTGASIVPPPAVVVTSIDCGAVTTTTMPSTTTTVTSTTSSTTTTTLPGGAVCGDPDGSGGPPTATDSLIVLNASVGLVACPLVVCDVDSSGGVTATDALRILRVAIGLPELLDCPD